MRALWTKKRDENLNIDEEDQHYSTMSDSAGWRQLKAHIETLKAGLDKRLAESVLKSLSDIQIKNDAMFSVLGKELLDSIIHRVEDSALVVQEIKDGKRE